jgi:hypothetical protein
MKIIENIKAGKKTRLDILTLHRNALDKLKQEPNNSQAKEIVEYIENNFVSEIMRRYTFVAFKPFGRLEDAQDKQWYKGGFYDLQYYEDKIQMGYYYELLPGDIIITKTNSTNTKDSEIGHMRIFAHGVITKIIDSSKNNHRWYKVNWTVPDLFLEVPHMGCTKAIAHRDLEVVEDKMPEDFWKWLDSTQVL